MPMTPFTWKRHILLILSSIWTIFFALHVPSKALQNLLKCKDNRVTSKDLKLYNENGHMCQPTTCRDPLHLEKTYLVHSFINLNDFCCIKYAKWRAIKWFWAPKKLNKCANICKSLSLRYQHVYLSSCN